ncbi:hypothetical protein [Ruminococcus albus]|uniref:hypothetical protein n=1 Tax=Ruminococcus albus TaxID=1264 RepID=UPI001FA7F525|nr:hypothetical protein [Ruminococcus albus]
MNYEIYIEESSPVRVLSNVIDEIYQKEEYTIVQRGRTSILQRFNNKREANLIAVIDNAHHVLCVVFAEDKRLRITFRWKRECERSGDL